MFLQLLFNIAGIGGIVLFLIMATNRYILLSNEEKILITKIVKTGYLPKSKYGCANAWAEVEIDNVIKEIIFPCGLEVLGRDKIEVKLKRGVLGFDVITSLEIK